MFTLGMVYWMFDRPLDHSEDFIEKKFKKYPLVVDANKKVLKAGYNFAKTIEALPYNYSVAPAKIRKGTYRNITGNKATAWDLWQQQKELTLSYSVGHIL